MPDPRAEYFGTYEHCGPDGSCFRPKGHEGGCVPRPQLPEGLFIATGLRGPVTIPAMTGGRQETAEDLNTGDSVQIDECAARAEPPELAAIRERVERDFVTDPASVSGVLSAELMQARIDRRALLANFDAELSEHAKPAPEMPRPPAVEAQERPEVPGTGSGRGTGVAEASGTAQESEEWGVRRRDGRVLSFENRDDAEAFADGWRGGERTVVHRFIGAWEPAPSLPVPSTQEARNANPA